MSFPVLPMNSAPSLARALPAALLLGLSLLTTGCVQFHVTEKQWLSKRDVDIAPDWLTQARAQADGELETFTAPSSDGTTLNLVLLRKPEARALVVYFAGAGTVLPRSMERLLDTYRDQPVNVLFHDYRGYGLSSGEPSLQGLRDDAHTVLEQAKRLSQRDRRTENAQPLPIIYHGFSLGSVVAAELAKTETPQGLILEGSATNVAEWADNSVPWWAWPFVRISIDPPLLAYDNVAATQSLRSPLLLITGDDDAVTPVSFARKIRDAHQFPGCVELQVIAKVGHGGALRQPEGRTALRNFVERIDKAQHC